jgi:hypothetical protein
MNKRCACWALLLLSAAGCSDANDASQGPGQAGSKVNENSSISMGGSGGEVSPGRDAASMGDPQNTGGSDDKGNGSDGGADSADGAASADAVLAEQPPAKLGHRVLSSVSHEGVLALVADDGHIEWQYDVVSLGGEANDAWLLPSGNVAFAYTRGAREVTPAKQVVWDYPAPAGSEVHSCQPLPDGNYLIGEAHDAGVGYLREVNASGQVVSTVTVTQGTISAHGQFREVRKTSQGTYLVTYLELNRAMELDATGKHLRDFPCGSFVAIRLPEGNTLIACGDAHRVIEVDAGGQIVWDVGENDVTGNKLGFAAGLQRLPNGDTVISNWPGHFAVDPHEPQAFELTRDKKVVWELNNPALGWVSNVELVDPAAKVAGVVLR